jgi:hypothetical protein
MGDILQIKIEQNLSSLTPQQLDMLRKRVQRELAQASLTLHTERKLLSAAFTPEDLEDLATLDVPDLAASPDTHSQPLPVQTHVTSAVLSDPIAL